jgi:hypothetical protein
LKKFPEIAAIGRKRRFAAAAGRMDRCPVPPRQDTSDLERISPAFAK